jgi:hypothetical protein
MTTTSYQLPRTVAATLAIGAALAPGAGAQSQDLRSPDTRDAAERIERTQDLRMPDTQDAAIGRGPEDAPVVEFVDVPEADRFDVTDAALGAGAGIGLVLIAAGGAAATVRFRRRPVGLRS